jgi:predicted permease
LRASRPELLPALKAEAFTLQQVPRALNLRAAFVVAQVALCVVVLAGAGLLLRTVWKASAVDLGFEPDGKLLVSLDVARQGYSPERGAAFYAELLERIRRAPGVEAAGLGNVVPVQSSGMRTSADIEGYRPPPGEYVNVDLTMVSPGYFGALGIPLLRGRDFTATDGKDAPLVAIINQEMAARYLNGRDPLGTKLNDLGPRGEGAVIVGVVANTKLRSVRETPRPKMFLAHTQFYMPRMTVIARTSGEPRALQPVIASVVAEMDKELPPFGVRTLREHLGYALAQERIIAGLLSAYGLVALLLAAVGLYGVVSYASETRTREFGIRVALGAQPGDVARLVVRQAALVTCVGTLVGLGGALASAGAVEKLLYGVPPRDPLTLAAVAFLMTIVVLVAAYVPARRAARIDPMVALRYE